jgi:hypothetical protein
MPSYEYHDRKMMKWMPFNALLEQGDHIRELLNGRTKKEMPILSEDQQSELNYKLEAAYLFKNEVLITYYRDGAIYKIEGVITRTDIYNKLIFIGDAFVSALQIINIETV